MDFEQTMFVLAALHLMVDFCLTQFDLCVYH